MKCRVREIVPALCTCYPAGVEKSRNENKSYENKALPTAVIPAKKKQFYSSLFAGGGL
jgi:hypothetical protein